MTNRLGFTLASFLLATATGSPAASHRTAHAPKAAFGVNLIVNGDAESGPGAPNDGSTLMVIPGWTRTGVFQVQQYGASGGFPDSKSPGPANRGKNFFAGGPGSNNNQTSATQTIDVTALAAGLKAGKAKYNFSAYIGGFGTQKDYGYVTASFQAATGKSLGSAKLAPVTPADRKSVTGLLPRSAKGGVPAGTTKIVVTMVSIRKEGAYHDGYFDNLELTLEKG